MRGGVDFLEASNGLICGHVTFRRRHRSDPAGEIYRVRFHPDFGKATDKQVNDQWVELKSGATEEDIVFLLPQKHEYDFEWTYERFMLGYLFWAEGYEKGFKDGEIEGTQRGRSLERRAMAAENAKQVPAG